MDNFEDDDKRNITISRLAVNRSPSSALQCGRYGRGSKGWCSRCSGPAAIAPRQMKLAGYGKASHKSVKSHASKFFMDDRVRAAVREVAEREIAICEPELLALTWTSLAMRAFLRATG
jgi:hypothetical protein